MNILWKEINMKNPVLVVVVALSLIGCATVGRKLDQSSVEKIKKGETTREEVLRLIGSPDQMTRDGNGNITMTYMYVRATAKPETFIPIIGAFAGGANVQNQMVMVVTGPDGVVKDIVSSYGSTESSHGLSTGSQADIPEVEQDKRPK
jgi:outer membrane protein assembly factor BamE (lipoprotein component of BamABCDE complex)